ncbi:MAG: manganese efflux pump MntP family protein [Oscillospiraceae bacterium]|nr:manganese efflux pump MntP family protein [Oscillospiraceae bacterium]
MNLIELFILAAGLSMDAFAVSICIGLTVQKNGEKLSFASFLKKALIVGGYFGVFQAGMPVLGYITASLFAERIINYDHWVAFILLSFLGVRMIAGSLQKDDNDYIPAAQSSENTIESTLGVKKMFPLAVATSIDAMAVGVSFAFLKVQIISAVAFIGVTTFVLSVIGVKIGNVFGARFKSKAEFAGGAILIFIGIKILIEHLLG